jgi:hypothetical protein
LAHLPIVTEIDFGNNFNKLKSTLVIVVLVLDGEIVKVLRFFKRSIPFKYLISKAPSISSAYLPNEIVGILSIILRFSLFVISIKGTPFNVSTFNFYYSLLKLL